MPFSSTLPSRLYSPATVPLKWTRAMPPMTTIRSTSRTSGVTWRRSGRPPLPRERATGTGRALVVRDRRDRPAPCCGPVTRRGDPSAGSSTGGALHHDDQRASQRSRPRAGRRPGPSPLSREPGRRRERLGLPARHAARSIGRRAHARHLWRSRDRGRLPTLTQQMLGAASVALRAPDRGRGARDSLLRGAAGATWDA